MLPSVIPAQAALFHGPGRELEFRAVPVPEPGPGEVLVRLSLATICGSDLHTLQGRRNEPVPTILGHEGVGRVLAVGEGRDPGLAGRRVTWSLADSCGRCPACREWDLPQKCERLFKYGHARMEGDRDLAGCYATHLLLRPGTAVVPVPEGLPDALVAPANCALATMVAALEGLPAGGRTAVLQGAGLLGLYGAARLRSAGWERVLLVDPNPHRRALAAGFGADALPPDAARRLPSALADVVVEVCGEAQVVPEGLRLLRPGGHYGWVGMVHPATRLELTGEAVVRRCATIRGTHNYAPRHLEEAVRFLDTHRSAFPWARLVSPPLPLAGLAQAFQLAETGQWARVAIRPGP